MSSQAEQFSNKGAIEHEWSTVGRKQKTEENSSNSVYARSQVGVTASSSARSEPVFSKPKNYGVYSSRLGAVTKTEDKKVDLNDTRAFPSLGSRPATVVKSQPQTNFKGAVEKCMDEEAEAAEQMKIKADREKAKASVGRFSSVQPFHFKHKKRLSDVHEITRGDHLYNSDYSDCLSRSQDGGCLSRSQDGKIDESMARLTLKRNRQQPTNSFQEVNRLSLTIKPSTDNNDDGLSLYSSHTPPYYESD
jgi:hypothetical protein